jgi:uncharacterized protein (DUF1330 family)
VSAYVISEVEIIDENIAARYRSLAERSITQYGGTYIVRGAKPEALEGAWPEQQRMVVVRFPDAATARRWYNSDEYAVALAIREGALKRRLLLVEGLSTEML